MQPQVSPLLAEAQRQFLICSACRYCESYCATFPAIEARSEYTAADAAYIANVCHDCRACYQACMYTAPHEFAVAIPKLLADLRHESYEERTVPAAARTLIVNGSGAFTVSIAVAFAAILLGAIALTGRWPQMTSASSGPGAFYTIVPSPWMVIPALVLAGWALVALCLMGRNLVRDVAPKLRPKLADVLASWKDGLNLTYMKGGGDGCYYPNLAAPGGGRRVLHVTLVAGVALAILATVVAAFMQDVLGILPPYDLVSIPVISGTLGGLCILVGSSGLLLLKARHSGRDLDVRVMVKLEYAFLWTLLAVAGTGLLLLVLRGTAMLGALLVLHLATVGALFVSLPYGKFIHVPLRLAALLIFQMEERDASQK